MEHLLFISVYRKLRHSPVQAIRWKHHRQESPLRDDFYQKRLVIADFHISGGDSHTLPPLFAEPGHEFDHRWIVVREKRALLRIQGSDGLHIFFVQTEIKHIEILGHAFPVR
jgi:hypothetical protein